MAYSQLGSRLVGTGYAGTYGPHEGTGVALSADGTTLAIGASGDGSGSTYVGAVWIFTWNGGSWVQQGSKLIGTGNAGAACRQGVSVALSADGNTLAVGANADNTNKGAVWIWTRAGSVWSQVGSKLLPSDSSGATPYFGFSVSLSSDGTTLAVGGYGDATVGSVIPGATWIFTFSGGVWTQQGSKLFGAGGTGGVGARQGMSVRLAGDGNTLVIGGPYDNNTTGAAWVFTRSGGAWFQVGSKLLGTGQGSGQYFGYSVAIAADGLTLAAGCIRDPNIAPYIGSTFVFAYSGGTWSQQGAKLQGTGWVAGTSSQQGYSLAFSADGNILAVGGYTDNNGMGATWVFARSGGAWSQVGSKLLGSPSSGINNSQGCAVSLSASGHFLASGVSGWGGQTDATGNIGGVFMWVADALHLTQSLPASLSLASGALSTSATIHTHAIKSVGGSTVAFSGALAAAHRKPWQISASLSVLSASLTAAHRVRVSFSASTNTATGKLTKSQYRALAASTASLAGALVRRHTAAQPLVGSFSAFSGTLAFAHKAQAALAGALSSPTVTLALVHRTVATGALAGISVAAATGTRQAVAAGNLLDASIAMAVPITEATGEVDGTSAATASLAASIDAAGLAAGANDSTGTLTRTVRVVPDTAAAFSSSTATATGTLVAVEVTWAAGNLPNGSGGNAFAIRIAVADGELDGACDSFATPFFKGNGQASGVSNATSAANRIRPITARAGGQAMAQGIACHLLLATCSTTGASTAVFDGINLASGLIAGANEADAIAIGTFAASANLVGLATLRGSAIKYRFAEGALIGLSTAELEPILPIAGPAAGSAAADAGAARTRWVSGTVTGSSTIHGGLFSASADTNLAAGYNELVGALQLIQGIRGYATGTSTVRGRLVAGLQTATGRIRSNAIVSGRFGFDRAASGEANGRSTTSAIPDANIVLATAVSSDNTGAMSGDTSYCFVAQVLIDDGASDAAAEPLCILGGSASAVTDPVVVAAKPNALESIRGQTASFSLAHARVSPNVRLATGWLGGESSAVHEVPPIVAEATGLAGTTDIRGYLASTMDGQCHGWSVSLLAGRACARSRSQAG